jgi:hypothetical protein
LQREEVVVLIWRYRSDRWEAGLESGISRFYLYHHDGLSGARDDVRLKALRAPIACQYD